jgi:beta-glucosidase
VRAFHKSGRWLVGFSTFSRGLHRGKPDADLHDWNVRSGKFDVLFGGSSRDLPPKETIEVQTTEIGYPKLTRTSMLKDFQNHPKGKAFYPQLVEASDVDIPFGEPRSFA